MKVFNSAHSIQEWVHILQQEGKSIGFVPTMGALHEGHISLVHQSNEQNDVTIVSIFVNPTQFNNTSDLEKYPRTIEQDLELLAKAGVQGVFTPNQTEIYPESYQKPEIDLGELEQVMEGKFRPGHFQGVVEVVKRLFEITLPTRAYFGMKDFQQVAVIQYMTRYFDLPVEIIPCPIKRSEHGLALSSRNMRLSEIEKEQALVIFQALSFASNNKHLLSPTALSLQCKELISNSPLQLEYLEIVNSSTLETLTDTWVDGAVCCIAAYCGEVRLIDNMIL